MTLQINAGKLLIDSGSLANSSDCCCDGDCCDSFSFSSMAVSLNFDSPDCCSFMSGTYVMTSSVQNFFANDGTILPTCVPGQTDQTNDSAASCDSVSITGGIRYFYPSVQLELTVGCTGGKLSLSVKVTWQSNTYTPGCAARSYDTVQIFNGGQTADCDGGATTGIVDGVASNSFVGCSLTSASIAVTP